jgi:hypothetical protein
VFWIMPRYLLDLLLIWLCNGYSGAAYKSFNSWRLQVASMFSDEDLDVRKSDLYNWFTTRVLS